MPCHVSGDTVCPPFCSSSSRLEHGRGAGGSASGLWVRTSPSGRQGRKTTEGTWTLARARGTQPSRQPGCPWQKERQASGGVSRCPDGSSLSRQLGLNLVNPRAELGIRPRGTVVLTMKGFCFVS